MFLYGNCRPEQIINSSKGTDGRIEYILVERGGVLCLFRINYRSYNNMDYSVCDLQKYTISTLDIIETMRKAPVKEVPMDLIEKIR